jgi:hypothetical protein
MPCRHTGRSDVSGILVTKWATINGSSAWRNPHEGVPVREQIFGDPALRGRRSLSLSVTVFVGPARLPVGRRSPPPCVDGRDEAVGLRGVRVVVVVDPAGGNGSTPGVLRYCHRGDLSLWSFAVEYGREQVTMNSQHRSEPGAVTPVLRKFYVEASCRDGRDASSLVDAVQIICSTKSL